MYFLLPTPEGNPIKTYQAQECLNILKEHLKDSKSITEDDFKAAIYAEQSRLKTKQDAWRIFQYYRPQLIANKYIKCEG